MCRLVEGIISDLQSEATVVTDNGGDVYAGEAGADGWSSLDSAGTAGTAGPQQAAALSEELVLLGFQQQDAAAAVAATGSDSLSAALDWLCMRIPEERLPKNFAPGVQLGSSLA